MKRLAEWLLFVAFRRELADAANWDGPVWRVILPSGARLTAITDDEEAA